MKMGISIDEAISHLGTYSSTMGSGQTTQAQHEESKRVSIDTMRKYQKIEQIVTVWHQDIYAKDFECMAEIAEVVEDGKEDDNRASQGNT